MDAKIDKVETILNRKKRTKMGTKIANILTKLNAIGKDYTDKEEEYTNDGLIDDARYYEAMSAGIQLAIEVIEAEFETVKHFKVMEVVTGENGESCLVDQTGTIEQATSIHEEPNLSKWCPGCCKVKPIECFSQTPNGYTTLCKECMKPFHNVYNAPF